MYREKMDLRIKLATLPFTDFNFYSHDYVAELGGLATTADYKRYMEITFLPQILPSLHRTERISHLDEIALLLEKFYPHHRMQKWTANAQQPESFYLYRLRELSSLFLTHRNGKVALKYWESSGEKQDSNSMFSAYRGVYKIALWNSLSRIMCPDILVMVYLLSNGMKDEQVLQAYHSLVYLPDTQLDGVLEGGLAETHLHLSASGHFTLNWQEMMAPRPDVFSRQALDHHSFVDQITGKPSDLTLYTVVAAVIRLVLASYLQVIQGASQPAKYSLSNFLRGLLKQETDTKIEHEISALLRAVYEGTNLTTVGYTLQKVQHMYEDVLVLLSRVDPPDIKEPNWASVLKTRDSLSRIFGTETTYTSPENLFLFRSIRYIGEQADDRVFAKLFWQYIRIKNQQFTRLIQRNHIRGLPYFKDYFAKATEVRLSEIRLQYWGFLLHHQLQSPHIRKLEVRIRPPKGNQLPQMRLELVSELLNFFIAYKQILDARHPESFAPQIGIIYHFIKTSDSLQHEKCWFDYSEQERNYEALHHKTNQHRYKKEMEVIRDMRELIPRLANYIVGIDAANLESYTEPWVFAPIFREARNSNTHELVYRGNPSLKINNLGLTYHVGEDFRHMLTGLRHLHEVIEHFQFRSGDRIGHGMVLGVQVSKWAARNRIIILPRIEMMENLLWMWGICKENDSYLNIDISYLESKIMKLAEQLYQSINGISVYLLWKSYRSKFQEEIGAVLPCIDFETKEQWFSEQRKREVRWTGEMLKHTYHCKCYLVRMYEPIEVEISHEDERLIEQIQLIVRSKVGREGIVIETNPTSNTAIGEIESIFEHYILHLNNRGLKADHKVDQGIMVTINTDDPIVFNTSIDNEFAYIFYSLLEKGYAREDILGWIDHVRETGLRSSFIETRTISSKELSNELMYIIQDIRQYIYG